MAVSFISPRLYWFLNLGVCQLYPGYLTFLYLYGKRVGLTTSSENTVLKGVYFAHHFVYWAIYLLHSYVESLFPFHKVVPFYYELKLLFFFWLGSDHFRGAGYLFQTYFGTLVNHASAKLRSLLDTSVDNKTKDAVSDFLKNLGSFGELKDTRPVRRQSSASTAGPEPSLRAESLD
ncbi:hypothetical protein MACJ_000266 [Theileria orientalis]|uniref:HVA22-like protein n=1 Tax=Theileria orientalis TaxID=68886 RepID=A0A976QQC4_THEOR|nr:hypothetical protein MACJ_000266 [Theileria orientalis]